MAEAAVLLRRLLAALLVLSGSSALAVEPPEHGLQRLMVEMQGALARGGPAGEHAAARLLRQRLVPLLDVDGIARRVTGPLWNALGPASQGRLKLMVRSRLEEVAVTALERHREAVRDWLAGASVVPGRPYGHDRRLVRLRHPGAFPDEVRLWLVRTGQSWRVANISASGFSLAGLSQAMLAPALGGGVP